MLRYLVVAVCALCFAGCGITLCQSDSDCRSDEQCQLPRQSPIGQCVEIVFFPTAPLDAGQPTSSTDAGTSLSPPRVPCHPTFMYTSSCAPDEFCESADDACGAGTCAPRPEACIQLLEPVIGCDGVEYLNACEAQLSGVDAFREPPFDGGTGPVFDAGTPNSLLGAACSQDLDCAALGGNPPRCKQQTTAGNLTYQDGFCTRRCVQDSDCGSEGMCLYGMGPFGEAENICVPKCDATTPCARTDGYVCLGLTQTTGGCWIDDTAASGGSNYQFVDAGPAIADGVVGSACTSHIDCAQPVGSSGFCAEESFGYPGGSCFADCTYSLTDASCGAGAACVLQLSEQQPGEDPFVIGLCVPTCASNSSCRSEYACYPNSTPSGQGVCQPRCDVAGGISCPATMSCNNGLCE